MLVDEQHTNSDNGHLKGPAKYRIQRLERHQAGKHQKVTNGRKSEARCPAETHDHGVQAMPSIEGFISQGIEDIKTGYPKQHGQSQRQGSYAQGSSRRHPSTQRG